MGTVRFGIIGCGNIGTTHARNLTEGKVKDGVLSCVCDKNPKKLEIFKEKYGDTIKYFSTAFFALTKLVVKWMVIIVNVSPALLKGESLIIVGIREKFNTAHTAAKYKTRGINYFRF